MTTNHIPYETHSYDVLVIGAGGAGMRAAVEACNLGQRTGLVCKSLLGKAHTVMAEGGMAAALANVDKRDGWETHFRDTMRGGKFLNQWRMAQLHAQEAPERVRELETWGAIFDRTPDGKILQRNFGGHKYPRLAHVGDRTGLEMIRTLQDRTVSQELKVHMECTIYRLLKQDGVIVGAVGFWRESGRPVIFKAKSVVLATGGLGKCYRVTSNSWEGTGDGQALAYLAGAELMDMEFIQFHPTGMVWPPSVKGILVTEGVRGEGGVLLNNQKERFMFKDVPELYVKDTANTVEEAEKWLKGTDKEARRPPELLTRDHVARKIVKEVKEGRGSPHGGVFLDIASRREPDYIRKKLPSMYHQFMELGGIDITKEPMEVGPTAHYAMGGIRVNPESQATTLPGLFACGESAAGLHGANRLGGNSLSDLIVFGKRAGEGAAHFAKDRAMPELDAAQVEREVRAMVLPFERPAGENAFQVTEALQETMELNVGIAREENEVKTALADLETLKARAAKASVSGDLRFNPGWHQALSLEYLLICSEAIARCALERRESRGGHMRVDYAESDDANFGNFNHIISRGEDGNMQLRRQALEPMPAELEKLAKD